MHASEQLAPPVGYSQWWLVLGIALVVLVIAVYAWVLWRPRVRRPAVDRGPAALAAIDSVVARVRAGTLDSRGAHQALAAAVRGFVGVDAAAMSLRELESAGSPLAAVIREWYPPEFAVAASGDPLRAADAARRLVMTWH